MTNNIILLMASFPVVYANNRLGTSTSGNDTGNIMCPDGRVLTKLVGSAGWFIDKIQGECDDGTQLKMVGGYLDKPNNYIIAPGPWKSMNANYGEYIDNLAGFGGGGGNHRSGTACPDGLYFRGYRARVGDIVDSMDFICGPKIDEFCVDNLEHPMCTDAVVNQKILNDACRKNMSATCVRRKNELEEGVMREFCTYFPNEPICACFKTVPDTFPAELRGEPPHCWDQTCAVSGYKTPNMQTHTCRDITICKQDINISGHSNLLSNNVIIQDCSDKTTINQQPIPNTSDNEGVGAVNQPNPPQPNQPTSTMTPEQIKIAYGINPTQQLEPTYGGLTIQNILYLFIMIIFVSIIGYAIYAYDSEDVEEPEIVTR